jgi:maleylacetoacetate isomerase
MQPFQNVSVLARVGEEKKQEWIVNFLRKGFIAIEEILKITAGKYCIGDEISIADLCLVPQVYGANRFNVSLNDFPIVKRINEELEKLDEFKKAHPSKQPDCPEDLK